MRDVGTTNDVRIVSFSHLDADATRSVSQMLVGDKTCSLDNMNVSCFASERCNSSRAFSTGDMNSIDMANGALDTYALVCDAAVLAVATTHRMSNCGFLGMRSSVHPDDVLLANLCVNQAKRSKGMGRTMIEHILKRSPANVYVSVRLPDRDAPDAVRSFMHERSQNLVSLYKHMQFTQVETTPYFTILSRSNNVSQ